MATARPIPCPTCRYDLCGLIGRAGALCPECGAWTDRSELLERRLHRVPIGWRLALLLTPIVMVTVFFAGFESLEPLGGAAIGWTTLASGLVYSFAIGLKIMSGSRRTTRVHRALLAAILALGVVLGSIAATFLFLFAVAIVLFSHH